MIAMVVLLTREGAERPQLEFINQGVVERSEAATALIVREEMLLPAPADGTLNRTIQEDTASIRMAYLCRYAARIWRSACRNYMKSKMPLPCARTLGTPR